MPELHIITPVKDAIELTLQTIGSVIDSDLPEGAVYTVYNDRSTAENRATLEEASRRMGFRLVHLEDITDRPSPNYITVLRMARKEALDSGGHLCIVESDVTVNRDTVAGLVSLAGELPSCGMAAAVTVDESGRVNYPYSRIERYFRRGGNVPVRKHLSFCCTVLSHSLLRAVDFDLFDETKSWFDVTISHNSLQGGLLNYVCSGHRVLHKPHGSRPWKHLKYSNPIRYYWEKITRRRDKI